MEEARYALTNRSTDILFMAVYTRILRTIPSTICLLKVICNLIFKQKFLNYVDCKLRTESSYGDSYAELHTCRRPLHQ